MEKRRSLGGTWAGLGRSRQVWVRCALTIFASRVCKLGLLSFFLRIFACISYALVFFVEIIQIRIVVFRRLLVVRSLKGQGRKASQ
jgi:hypothetical protein